VTAVTRRDDTLFGRFLRTADRHPDAVALEVGGDVVTYAELLALTERAAALLLDATGHPPAAVGLLASRSLAMYCGYLAALRVGATVVPLSPAAPASRTRDMCRAADVEALVVDRAATGSATAVLDGLATARVVALGEDGGWRTGSDRVPVPVPGRIDDVAYVLFTSGSTGTPKGVPIRHRNLTEYVPYCAARYQVGPGCRLSQTFEPTFDPSVFDLFVAWSAGAAVVVPGPDEVLTAVRFAAARRITHWFSVPSVISIARRLRALRPGAMPELRWSLFAGEPLTLDQARAWAAAAPGSVVENLYGPTELAITCTGYRLPDDPSLWPRTSNGTVPIGHPYPHLEAALLGPDGDEGELCLRGSQRFDGYLDPAHDRDRFVRRTGDSFEAVEGRPDRDCWYRTGDRVRREGGELVHLGRVDDQVKIYGHRVELGEVEHALRGHPAVDDVVVVAVAEGGADACLHALYVGSAVAEAELTTRARDRLPPYMVPRRCLRVPELPVTANGKIDRRRLARVAAELAAKT
jgi:amino acid adenylation domain-containing protein